MRHILPDTKKLWSLSWCARLGVHFQRVNMTQAENSGSNTPRKSQNGADTHHNTHNEHVKMVATTFLKQTLLLNHVYYWVHTLSLCSFLLTMTEVICWSMKRRMVRSRAGMDARKYTYQGELASNRGIVHPRRSDLVGYYTKIVVFCCSILSWLTLKTVGTISLGVSNPKCPSTSTNTMIVRMTA